MTVSCLTQEAKNMIYTAHTNKTMTQKEMAEYFGVSERTINRVLNELGLATAVPRIKGEAYQVLRLLEKHNFTIKDLETLLEANSATDVEQLVDEYLMEKTHGDLIVLFNAIHKRKTSNAFQNPAYIDAA